MRAELPNWKFKDFVDNQFVISGSPATVRDSLTDAIKKLNVGNLMVLLHIGSMPHELTLKNITQIKEAFVGQLLGMYHSRIKYPENVVPIEGLRDQA